MTPGSESRHPFIIVLAVEQALGENGFACAFEYMDHVFHNRFEGAVAEATAEENPRVPNRTRARIMQQGDKTTAHIRVIAQSVVAANVSVPGGHAGRLAIGYFSLV